MALERWGTQSVRDHLNLESLVANVILYDRLVFPVPPDMAEVMRWREMGWEPDELNDRLGVLDELAVKRPWDAARQEAYQQAMTYSRGLDNDIANVIDEQAQNVSYQNTRMVLAQEERFELPAGVTRVDVVAAFNSSKDLEREALMGEATDRETMALLFQHELTIPDDKDPAVALREAVALSRDQTFKDRRRDYYEWQHQVLAGGVKPEVAVREMAELIELYNRAVEKAARKVRRKFAFTVGSISLQLAGAVVSMNPLPAASALLQFISFKVLDSTPTIDPNRSKPAAMFHDAKKLLG